VAVNNGWNGNYVSALGATGSNFYAQSFIANVSAITEFGVVIQQVSAVGQIVLEIAADNGSGVPVYSAPLYQGTLISPTTTGTWYYETGINVPVTPGQKYYVLLNGYNNPGATGWSRIGLSDTQPNSGQGMIYSNSGGVGAWSNWGVPLAIYIEGVPLPVPTLNMWGMITLMISLMLVSLYFLKRFRTE
jgi:spore coat protein U-like protein